MLTKEERRKIGAEIAGIVKKNPAQFAVDASGRLDMRAVYLQISDLVPENLFNEHINSIMSHARNFYSRIFQIGPKKWAVKDNAVEKKYMAEKAERAAAKKRANDRLKAAVLSWSRWRELLAERTPISLAKEEIIAFIDSLVLSDEYEMAAAQAAVGFLKSGQLPGFLRDKARLVFLECVPPFLADVDSDWESHVRYFERNDQERWEKVKNYQEKYRERYFRKHNTTEANALRVWKKIGGIGPVPVPGFWNVGDEAHFSRCALGLNEEFSLLSHHNMRYRPKSLYSVGIGHTPYGEVPVYRTSDVVDYKNCSEERRSKQRLPQVFDFNLSTIVACLVMVNRHARRLSRVVPLYYKLDMHGVCGY